MNQNNRPVVDDRLAELASEVVRVMHEEKLGLKGLSLAISIVMSREGNGFGDATKVTELVSKFLCQNPQVLNHFKAMSWCDAQALWERRQEESVSVPTTT